ncbi:MAG TPA: hypothetical protein PLT94_10220 [Rhodocyclaceae bacterium]|nr:hypothetical protein [Rhodocyclaceae bacterium]HNA02509.1 hypothetical protein [Rhodocyclaceae bacterium]HNB78898.1 hypothetical protein [Rhodocyclaceae bacterium]HNC60878.1 hypothetical protein [Rhodocyclaceae bacterium]HNH98155.1 hypothetical protein [Rhodocyclaceae bacterium]
MPFPGLRNPALRCVAAVILALCVASPLLAGEPHRHDSHAAAHGLVLDDGRKWPTDPPLRDAMTVIRKDIDASLHDIHRNRLSNARYAALAATVEARVADIVANCKLAPEADAQLHLVIADLLDGAAGMAGKRKDVRRSQGAAKVVSALQNYGNFFDHPGWQPIAH